MGGEWQNWAALALVLMAAAYLVHRGWRSIARKRAGACGACGSCPAGNANTSAASSAADPTGKPLVKLDALVKARSGPTKL